MDSLPVESQGFCLGDSKHKNNILLASLIVSDDYMSYFKTMACNSDFWFLVRLSRKCLREIDKLKFIAPPDAIQMQILSREKKKSQANPLDWV